MGDTVGVARAHRGSSAYAWRKHDRRVTGIIQILSALALVLFLVISPHLGKHTFPSNSKKESPTAIATESRMKTMILENANRKIQERRAWLSPKHSEGSQFSALTNAEIFYMFSPVMPCFWTFEKDPPSNIVHDGPKWLCGLQELHELRQSQTTETVDDQQHFFYKGKPCVVYSMGSNNDFTFEKRVRLLAPGCEIHTFDPTSKETGKGKQFYNQYHGDYGFGGVNADRGHGRFAVKSIATIMRELNHSHVDYLKIDVEGYEWDFLKFVQWDLIKVGQLLIEFHPNKLWKGDDGRSVMNAGDMNVIFNKLENAGFRLISLEPVTYTDFAQVELVFLHKDWDPSGDW